MERKMGRVEENVLRPKPPQTPPKEGLSYAQPMLF